jgi:hypothetical protein
MGQMDEAEKVARFAFAPVYQAMHTPETGG